MKSAGVTGILVSLAFAGAAGAADVVYVYDELGRLISVTYPSGKTITYTYDDAGNITNILVTP